MADSDLSRENSVKEEGGCSDLCKRKGRCKQIKKHAFPKSDISNLHVAQSTNDNVVPYHVALSQSTNNGDKLQQAQPAISIEEMMQNDPDIEKCVLFWKKMLELNMKAGGCECDKKMNAVNSNRGRNEMTKRRKKKSKKEDILARQQQVNQDINIQFWVDCVKQIQKKKLDQIKLKEKRACEMCMNRDRCHLEEVEEIKKLNDWMPRKAPPIGIKRNPQEILEATLTNISKPEMPPPPVPATSETQTIISSNDSKSLPSLRKNSLREGSALQSREMSKSRILSRTHVAGKSRERIQSLHQRIQENMQRDEILSEQEKKNEETDASGQVDCKCGCDVGFCLCSANKDLLVNDEEKLQAVELSLRKCEEYLRRSRAEKEHRELAPQQSKSKSIIQVLGNEAVHKSNLQIRSNKSQSVDGGAPRRSMTLSGVRVCSKEHILGEPCSKPNLQSHTMLPSESRDDNQANEDGNECHCGCGLENCMCCEVVSKDVTPCCGCGLNKKASDELDQNLICDCGCDIEFCMCQYLDKECKCCWQECSNTSLNSMDPNSIGVQCQLIRSPSCTACHH